MKFVIEYTKQSDRQSIMDSHSHMALIEEHNTTQGNFLIFSDNYEEDTKQIIYVSVPEEEFGSLKQENTLLKAQSQANSDRADFHEEVLAEIILAINP
ncbi:hypothetical protein [Psychrobacillus sp. BM2]|uniref:hypothetical protein n=1 Tax=Psychrobacillus sp. BM2 TaxID=3400421 RepID=UPI003B02E9AB